MWHFKLVEKEKLQDIVLDQLIKNVGIVYSM